MLRYNSQLKALGFNLLTHTYCDADSLVLSMDHVHDCLENENVLLLHLFYLELEVRRKLYAVLKLRELNHLALFYVDL